MINPILSPLATSPDSALPAGNLSKPEKIQELSREFESLLLRQILKESRKEIFGSGLFESSNTSDLYNDMINHHLADGISQSGGFGLAQSLAEQLTRQHGMPPSNPQPTESTDEP